MMERHFDEELQGFKEQLLNMATLTEESIYKSSKALENLDSAIAARVIETDKVIDKLEIAIEERGIELLAKRQPMATDLRFITTGLKINAELERIADLAVNISQRAIELAEGGKTHIKPLVDLPKLGCIAREMLKNTIDAFVNRDEEKATHVIFSDKEANELKSKIQNELIYEYIVHDGTLAPRAIPLILAARHLERICDHTTYISEDIIYMIKAVVVKHHRDELEKPEG